MLMTASHGAITGGVTVSEAVLLVAVPAKLVATTVSLPALAIVTFAIVYELAVAPLIFTPFRDKINPVDFLSL